MIECYHLQSPLMQVLHQLIIRNYCFLNGQGVDNEIGPSQMCFGSGQPKAETNRNGLDQIGWSDPD